MKYLFIKILILSLSFSAEIKTEPTIADSLPDNIPFLKSVIWGENGLVRDTFIDPKSRICTHDGCQIGSFEKI